MNFVLPDDERFADFLRTALQDVHTPVPSAPRDEMWTSIMEQRRGASVSASAPRATASRAKIEVLAATITTTPAATINRQPAVVTAAPQRRYSVPMRWAVPIAAAVLVFGVGAGWQFERARIPSSQVADAEVPQLSQPVSEVATAEHLRKVEMLLASYEANNVQSEAAAANNAVVEAQIAAWARDLLATTQLLLDSPLGMDPQRRKLLTDVEMVLVQISQSSPNSLLDERALTEEAIEQSQMMERLQNAAPPLSQAQPQMQQKAPLSGVHQGI